MENNDSLPELINGVYICPPPPSYYSFEDITDMENCEDLPFFNKLFGSLLKYKTELKNIAYKTPEFINLIKSSFPEEILTAVFTDAQKQKIAEGSLKFMRKKIDGSMMAVLVDPNKNNRIVAQLPLESRKIAPDLDMAISNFNLQLQMAEIAKALDKIQTSVNNVIIDLRDDRLALSDSNKQKYLQCIKIKNPQLKNEAMLRIIMDSEDTRNRIMKDLEREVAFIQNQPDAFFNKLLKGASVKEIDSHINNVRVTISSINQLSCIEAMCYHDLDEKEAMLESLNYYSEYITKTFSPTIINRLHSFDGANDDYWLSEFPSVTNKIYKLKSASNELLVERCDKNG